MHDKVISLGNQLVEELAGGEGIDTLSRWMAHYVAEQIAISKSATGIEKTQAEERCFQTILQLWERRATFPRGRRPFEKFEPILQVLARLNPEEPRPFYHPFSSPYPIEEEPEQGSVQQLVDFVLSVDKATRVLIEEALREAAEKANKEGTKTLLLNAIDTIPNPHAVDLRIIANLIALGQPEEPRAESEEQLEKRRIQDRISRLSEFCNICSKVQEDLEKESVQKGFVAQGVPSPNCDQTTNPFDGLSVRASRCLKTAGLMNRAEVLAAIQSGKLRPYASIRDYGKKHHAEICKWLGIANPQK